MRLRPAHAGYGSPSAIDVYQQQEQPRRNGDYLSRVYDWGNDSFIKRPYKGLGLLGGILGGLSGLAFGPLGVLFGAAVVGSIGVGYGTALYWGWTRGKRKPNNTNFDVFEKDGRSLGKWYADYIQTMDAQARARPQPTG